MNESELLKRCISKVSHIVLCCTHDQRKRLAAAETEVQMAAMLFQCAAENAITIRCPSCSGVLERVMADEPWAEAHFQCTLCQGTFSIDERFNPDRR